ncbi:HAD family hydrolase [Rhodohalobacter sp. 8-1]|uniref:HAD family hydrolase n=1 Tax=Rhodohalobacter sp. 8-1 TaxID=3131972 RepID=UPI0030EF9C1B
MSTSIGAIFDMDGVIVHSNPAHEETIIEFCEKYDRDVSDEFLRNNIFGRTNKEWIPELFGDITGDTLASYADEKEAMFRERFDPSSAMIDGIVSFLDQLKEKSIPCVLATSAPGANADYILDALNIRSHFKTILDSSHVNLGKPEPEVYLKAAKSLNLPPSQCIVFEDSLAGVEAGRRAGAHVVGITSTHTSEELGDCVATYENFSEIDLDELLELID